MKDYDPVREVRTRNLFTLGRGMERPAAWSSGSCEATLKFWIEGLMDLSSILPLTFPFCKLHSRGLWSFAALK